MFNKTSDIVYAIELIEQANQIQQSSLNEDAAFDIHMLLESAIARLEQSLEEMEGELELADFD